MNSNMLHSSPRELAIERMYGLMAEAWRAGNISEARWYEQCLSEWEHMTNQQFDERYDDRCQALT